LLLVLASAVIEGLITIYYSLRFKPAPNLEGHVPVFISRRNKVA
jgi:hypothetical protein